MDDNSCLQVGLSYLMGLLDHLKLLVESTKNFFTMSEAYLGSITNKQLEDIMEEHDALVRLENILGVGPQR